MKSKDIKLRDYFAAHALTGLLANPKIIEKREMDDSNIFSNGICRFTITELAIYIGAQMVDDAETYDE